MQDGQNNNKVLQTAADKFSLHQDALEGLDVREHAVRVGCRPFNHKAVALINNFCIDFLKLSSKGISFHPVTKPQIDSRRRDVLDSMEYFV